jgi:hypothetical protein
VTELAGAQRNPKAVEEITRLFTHCFNVVTTLAQAAV